MGRDVLKIDAGDIEKVEKAISDYGTGAGQIIDEILHGEGEQEIERQIQMLLPSSGRRWKGKAAPAKGAQPFTHVDGSFEVTVKTRPRYHYLYFPDDGSNTLRHAGDQHFMKRGAEAAVPRIVELCLGKLTEEFK